MNDSNDAFTPNWASPPGDTISDLLEERDWTQVELAQRMGYTTKHISLLINGEASVTTETALKLECVLGGTAGFWLAREAQYREALLRLEEGERLANWVGWLDKLPLKELMNTNAIAKQRNVARNRPALVKELLRFFGVASPDEWAKHYGEMQVAFRRTRETQSDIGAISAWLRLGEIEAEKFDGPKYDKAKFEQALNYIRSLTVLPPQDFSPRLHELCRESGVALVLVPAIPRSHVSGVARWLNPHKPLIQLSLYGKSNDKFWFSFFHEAAHILKHGKKAVFLDEIDGKNIDSMEEREANEWAGTILVPSKYSAELPLLRTKESVCAFAEKLSVHPGIVVGRLQHDGLIDNSWMNGLKVSLRLGE